MSLPSIKGHDAKLLRGDGESRGGYCEKHDEGYYEHCDTCIEREERAAKMREERKLRAYARVNA